MSEKKQPDWEDDSWRDGLTVRERNLHMLEHGISTDCTFVVGPEDDETHEFKAHRFLLSNASVVFEKMLSGEMSEAKTGHVRVTDISPRTFYLLLRFIYADEAEMTTFEEARDVALAADKYQIQLLFEKVLSSLCNQLVVENVWAAVMFVHLLPHEELKEACVKLIREETEECIADKGFMKADEEAVALLLDQDVLNVENELVLVSAAVTWAQHEARRRGLRGNDEDVRAVLRPSLLARLRLLTVSVSQFVSDIGSANWLTASEKWQIVQCMHTKSCTELPEYLCKSLLPRERSIPVSTPLHTLARRSVMLQPNMGDGSRPIFPMRSNLSFGGTQ